MAFISGLLAVNPADVKPLESRRDRQNFDSRQESFWTPAVSLI